MAIFLLQPLMYAAIEAAFFGSSEGSFASMNSVKQASVFGGLSYDGKAILGLGMGVLMVLAVHKTGLLSALKTKAAQRKAKSAVKTTR